MLNKIEIINFFDTSNYFSQISLFEKFCSKLVLKTIIQLIKLNPDLKKNG